MRLPGCEERVSHVPNVPPLERVEISIRLVEDVHSQNPPVILETGCRINSVVIIQRPLPKHFEVRHLGFLEEMGGVVAKLAAVSG